MYLTNLQNFSKEGKMRRTVIVLLGVVLLLGGAAASYADVVNGGFESGDFTGWTLNYSAGTTNYDKNYLFQVTNAWTTMDKHNISPVEGQYFSAIAAYEQDTPVTLSQAFSLNAGDKISG